MGYVSNPQLGPVLSQADNTQQTDTSDADNYYKQILRGFGRKGHDVSTVDAFRPFLDAGATQQRQADESAASGDPGLMMATGTPEQQALLSRQNEINKERIKEGTGEAIAEAAPGMVQEGTAYGEQQAANTNAFNLGLFGAKTGAINENSQYRVSPWLGFAQSLISGGARAATAAI